MVIPRSANVVQKISTPRRVMEAGRHLSVLPRRDCRKSHLAGYKTAGMAGAAVSCIASVIPALLILSVISAWYVAFSQNQLVGAVLKGMRPGWPLDSPDLIIDMVRIVYARKVTASHCRFSCQPSAAFSRHQCGRYSDFLLCHLHRNCGSKTTEAADRKAFGANLGG